MKLTESDVDMLRSLPITVYSPSTGGGRHWAHLIMAKLVDVRDVGSDEAQETILRLTLTKEGVEALKKEDRHD